MLSRRNESRTEDCAPHDAASAVFDNFCRYRERQALASVARATGADCTFRFDDPGDALAELDEQSQAFLLFAHSRSTARPTCSSAGFAMTSVKAPPTATPHFLRYNEPRPTAGCARKRLLPNTRKRLLPNTLTRYRRDWSETSCHVKRPRMPSPSSPVSTRLCVRSIFRLLFDPYRLKVVRTGHTL